MRGGALGCCCGGAGFDDASGWGSVNVAAFEQQAVAAEPPILHIAMSAKGSQSAIRARAIKTTVSCSPACLLGAYAMVRIGHGKAVEQDSRVLSQKAAGSTTVSIALSKTELRKLKAGRKAHHSLSATVYGVLFNTTVYDVIHAAGESVQTQTSGRKVKLS